MGMPDLPLGAIDRQLARLLITPSGKSGIAVLIEPLQISASFSK
jgi:hypothetical protein